MAFSEILTVLWESTVFVGNLIFHSVVALSVILLTVGKFLVNLCLVSAEYIIASLWVLGLFLYNCLPYIVDFVQNFAVFLYEAWIYACNTLMDFVLSVWQSPLLHHTRDAFIWGLEAGVGAVLQHPLECGRVAAGVVFIFLVLKYRQDLVGVVQQGRQACVKKVETGRMRVAEGGRRLKDWVMRPFRAVARIPAKTSAAAGALGQKIKASGSAVSFPSLRALYTSEQPHPEESVDALRSNIRKLKERLEEERDGKLCVVCHDNLRNIVSIPCRHFALCEDCINMLPTNIFHNKLCPVCRKQIQELIKIFV
ncbi:uncharacterized protein LOC129595831 [Paramacrobiotus metropolitanus]|uniref:uncharacterized protein LOC129595831 n=1 Tax=Paramacrobiotus metropolitanus TaxID=2943436 RepID=UPI002445A747|nr:uncharacterized protein LOC129595831 [Paramacrobiotus metropolitanus]XP_055348933.1 uncharacterized protein LOC129595831 [Paramacrobiotus metropolitanus]